MRSIARWVLPVLGGPRTAVTPEPGARSGGNEDEAEKAIIVGVFCRRAAGACRDQVELAMQGHSSPAGKMDQVPDLMRSHPALTLAG